MKPSVTTTSHDALVDVGAFDVADEVEVRFAQQLVRLDRKLVALAGLFAVVQQADARPLHADDLLHVSRAHLAELHQVAGRQSTLAPTSMRKTLAGVVGQQHADGRPLDAGMRPRTKNADAMTAPVLPAETTASALPSRTRAIATLIAASGF